MDPSLSRGNEKSAFPVDGSTAFASTGITHSDVNHLMIYHASCPQPGASFAHLPIYGLEDLGFALCDEEGRFIAVRNTAPRRPRDGPPRPTGQAMRAEGPRGGPGSTPMGRSFLHAFRRVRHVGAAGERFTVRNRCNGVLTPVVAVPRPIGKSSSPLRTPANEVLFFPA